MKKTIISLSFTSLIALCGSAMLYSQPVVALQGTTSSPTQLKTRLDSRTPLFVIQGFDALKVNDIEKASKIWTDSSIPIMRNNVFILTNTLSSMIGNAGGRCIGYTVIDTLSLTRNTKIIYVESQHESGALFWRITVHQTPTRPLITSIDLNTDPSKIIPMNHGGFLSR